MNILSDRPRRTHPFFDEDGPGELLNGLRHDNDRTNFRDIQILPSVDEVLSVNRSAYMPKKNIDQPHFLRDGIDRLLDTHFRHLRYDSTESLRDICYTVAQRSFLNDDFNTDDDRPFQKTLSGNRYQLYTRLKAEDLLADEQKGMVVRLSFECPPSLRGPLLHKSTRLQKGMLCAIMAMDIQTQELSIIYCDIHMRESTISMQSRGGGKRRAAVQVSFHENTMYKDILYTTRLALGLCQQTTLVLVEFPKVLHAGFHHPLQRLQQISANDIAFQKYLIPHASTNQQSSRHLSSHIGTPLYAQKSDFLYDLSPLTDDILAKRPCEDFVGAAIPDTVKYLCKNTTLDEGQSVALCNSLGREFSFVQGPPGTGKTFLGVTLARVLLASRPSSNPKPLVVTCLTNHALDAFLAGLRDAGVEKLLRVGGGSKEDWTRTINLQERIKKSRFGDEDFGDLRGLRSQKKHVSAVLNSWCQGLSRQIESGRPSWHQIEPVLERSYPNVHRQFFAAMSSVETQSFAFDYWIAGGDLNHIDGLHKELSSRILESAFSRSKDDREMIERSLEEISVHAGAVNYAAGHDNNSQVDLDLAARDLAFLHRQYKDLLRNEKEIKQRQDTRVMQYHNVIGITTTGCASRWELLRTLEPEILICEEAGEVMEAHALCLLLPSLKHAVFIGDPLQLRPTVQEQALKSETRTGSMYRLDESLFERIMMPKDPLALVLPTSQLSIQRRMHPEIAQISRITYPFLKNHQSTHMHPPPRTIGSRIHWLDHRVSEVVAPGISNSHCNPHEVSLVRGLVQYLLRGSGYSYGDIAVLTPYAAQLSRLHEALRFTCTIWLSDKDREILIDNGQLDLDYETKLGKANIEMSNMLRLATVDSFQGEEAKIVILSTVRSGGSTGFLKSQNRINVACSRARDGFYIIGNAETLSQVAMWKQIISVFETANELSPTILLQCDRHPQHRLYASSAEDFEKFEQCSEICGTILPCGHTCDEACHDLALHGRMPCLQPCKRILAGGHLCPKTCAEECGEQDLRYEYTEMHGIQSSREQFCKEEAPDDNVNMAAAICSFPYIELPDIFDRGLSKIGQTIYTLSTAIDIQRAHLEETFKHFIEDIRPNPRAAAINAWLVLGRTRETEALRSRVIEFRDKVIVPFEYNLAKLHTTAPNLVPKYTLMFRLRADVLEHRVMFTSIADRFRIIDFLFGVDDFSDELKRQARKILEFVYTECVTGVKYCQYAIDNPRLATNPCLETEVGLQKVKFLLLSRIAGHQLKFAGAAILTNQVNTASSDLLVTLNEIETTARRYPTCKLYLETISRFRSRVIEHKDIERIPEIYSARSRDVEQRWSGHHVGNITMCKENHPYSGQTFPDCCPECGEREEIEEDTKSENVKVENTGEKNTMKEEKRYAEEHLFEADFLAAMHK